MVWPAIAAAGVSVAGNYFLGDRGRSASIRDTTPREFRGLREPVAGQLGGALSDQQFQGNLQQGLQGYGGPFAAGMGGAEQQTLGAIGDATATSPQGIAQARQTLTNAAQGQFLDPSSNPFLAASIETAQRPIVDMFQNQVVPGLRSQFTQAGQQVQGEGSSPFQDAAGRAAVGFANALGDVSTNIVAQNYQHERQRMLDSAAQLPGLDRAELDRMFQNLEAQALPRMIEQFGIDRGLQEFQRQQAQLMQILAMGTGAAAGHPMGLPGTPAQPGLLQEGASAFLQNYAAAQGQRMGSGG